MAPRTLRAALDQGTGHSGDTAHALRRLADRARTAAAGGADLLIGPEMSLTGYNIGDDVGRLAEAVDGPLAQAVSEIAADTGVAIVHGFPERDGDAVYNTVRLVDGAGTHLAAYRKTHLFGDLDRDAFTPGDVPVVQADLAGVRLGLLVCYDVEFPEPVRAHALAGTELLIVPTALMRPFLDVPNRIVPVRALENQIHLAYVNRCDTEGDLRYAGLSALIAPDGSETLRAGADEELLIGDVDPGAIGRAREEQSYLDDRRPELYGAPRR
ncbi:carbon-nitrogen hydrolase family protein [Nocardiopsis sp. N85]|uniref:carbon-nitrogen hydrolase family protein n=1 Tax=Nocardiopsis sp. N85 TaxID=3029400 RepID=UPI00237F8511|nr:carbon-nitrogen hydrolase family protein [Nocardiopsis sp. N85]MDE3721214.1 carbon-nitrogen hydrolase family protein [Nocardiopsis sp. N85]